MSQKPPPKKFTKTPINGTKFTLLVSSAKGGVGKSTVAVNLAFAMQNLGLKIGILDADVYGPNQNILFNLDTKNEIVDKQIIPIKKKGIKIISMGNIMNYDDAAIWRGPMLSGAIKKLVHDTKWGELDYLLIDMPPGTGDVYLTILNELSIDKFILITTPNILAISDLQKTLTMLKKLNVSIFGYICNNIFNIQDKDNNFFISNKIRHLGTYEFEKNLHDFDLDYNPHVTEDISKIILSDV